MNTLSPYSIGKAPTFDPCEKCIVKIHCSEICDDRLRYIMAHKKPSSIKIRFPKRRKKKK